MRQLILIGIFLGLTIQTNGQSNNDKQNIAQKCIDIVELQQYFHADEVKGRKPLIINNNGIIPTNLPLTKFGEPVKFMTKEELFFYDKKAYQDFNKFEIKSKQAYVTFRYDIEGLEIMVIFEKVENNWTIKTKKLTEN